MVARVITPAFAERGSAPSVPGPLIRAAAGTPVHVTVHNRLAHPIEVRGLLDRDPGAERPPGVPSLAAPFLFAEPLAIPAGESRVARFTPSTDVSSFYFGRVVPTDAPPFMPPFIPGGTAR
jgi:FtsP/CotA-like multicopper oxidase with cupredoxin domain